MLIPPHYELTPTISKLVASIEASKAVIDSFPLEPALETNIRRQTTLKSSLFSARIEGNDLTLEEIERNPSRTQKKAEVFNLLKAFTFIRQKEKKDLSVDDIRSLHKLAMEGLSGEAGKLRIEDSAIYNTAGIAIYLPPAPRHIASALEKLVKFTNGTKEMLIPVKACLIHYSFEKIHPFLDGNGRVGRLLIQKVLAREGYGMKGLLAVEEYLDNHRSIYYKMLESPERDVTDYLEFMLEAIDEMAKKAKDLVLQKQQVDRSEYLLPRRQEIYFIIKEHRIVSFDQIRRRFVAVNERTLRYDLKKLQDASFIKKRGTTKGVFYECL